MSIPEQTDIATAKDANRSEYDPTLKDHKMPHGIHMCSEKIFAKRLSIKKTKGGAWRICTGRPGFVPIKTWGRCLQKDNTQQKTFLEEVLPSTPVCKITLSERVMV